MNRQARSRSSRTCPRRWVIPGSAVVLLLIQAAMLQGQGPRKLVPQLTVGQTLRYENHTRLQRQVKTESRVSSMLGPREGREEFSSRLRLTVTGVRKIGGRPVVSASAEVQSESSEGGAAKEKNVQFTVAGNGQLTGVHGTEGLSAEERLACQFWLARFAYGWTLPSGGAKPGDKWKTEEEETSPSPIAKLWWERETAYVRNDRCPVLPAESCAVFLTRAVLKQKSPSKDATPEDYRLRELKTSGTAQGTNETITYISLRTGLMMRATEDVHQVMDVIVTKADGSNGVRYAVEVKSSFETVLAPGP